MRTHRRHIDDEHRTGLLLMEVLAAAALLGVVLAIVVPVLASVTAIRDEASRRQQAQLEVANVMEQISHRHRAGETVAAIAPTIAMARSTSESLPQAQLAVESHAAEGISGAVEVALKLTWVADSGRKAAPVELRAYFVEPVTTEGAP